MSNREGETGAKLHAEMVRLSDLNAGRKREMHRLIEEFRRVKAVTGTDGELVHNQEQLEYCWEILRYLAEETERATKILCELRAVVSAKSREEYHTAMAALERA